MASKSKPVPKTGSRDLKNQAATAALYVTGARAPASILDGDGKLSSASAATSLKRAQPSDLPSFPIAGLVNPDSSAGAAASLAAAHPKKVERWTPGDLPAAQKAAYLAKDYHAEPLWQPDVHPEVHSAAGQAFRMEGLGPEIYRGVDHDDADSAHTAATRAFREKRYDRPFPPVPEPWDYPDAKNAAANAITAATSATSAGKLKKPRKVASMPGDLSSDLPLLSQDDARRIHNAALTNMSAEMYTYAPPVAPEKKKWEEDARLKAAAISMARSMYVVQQKLDAASRTAAQTATDRKATNATSDETSAKEAARQYLHLQDAAHKLAAERLAKMHDEGDAYLTYYGQRNSKRGFSLRGRRRSSGDSSGFADPDRARKIRLQMSGLQTSVQQVDDKKRKDDREALMAAAQRNVRQSMHGMDERVFAETGKASPAMQAEWEKKATERAKEQSKARMTNYGKVNIGGGKYMDQAEVDAIAAARVQPTLDQISEKAAAARARDEALRIEQAERRAELEQKEKAEKARARATDEEWKKFKDDEKTGKKRAKEEEKERKAAEKKAREAKVEEAQWEATRLKERAKEEEAEKKVAKEADERAEREKSAKLAAEFEAIKAEDKRKSKQAMELKEKQELEKEAEGKKKRQQENEAKELERARDKAAKEFEKETKERQLKENQEREAMELIEEKKKQRQAREAEELEHAREKAAKSFETRHDRELEKTPGSKEAKPEVKEAEEEKVERSEEAQKIHEIAERVRAEARTQALLQYLKQEQDKVNEEQEHETEAKKEHGAAMKEVRERERKEEMVSIDREIEAEKERKEHEKQQAELRRVEQEEAEKRMRNEEQKKIDREIEAEKDKKAHEKQQAELRKVEQEEAEDWMHKEELKNTDRIHRGEMNRLDSEIAESEWHERRLKEQTVAADVVAVTGTAPDETKKGKLQKGKAVEPTASKSSDKAQNSPGQSKTDKAAERKRARAALAAKDEKSGEDKKDQRRSLIGAFAGAIGIGATDKAGKSKEPVSEPDSAASTPLASEAEDEEEKAPPAATVGTSTGPTTVEKSEDAVAVPTRVETSKKAATDPAPAEESDDESTSAVDDKGDQKGGTGIPETREDLGEHEMSVEKRVAIPPIDISTEEEQQRLMKQAKTETTITAGKAAGDNGKGKSKVTKEVEKVKEKVIKPQDKGKDKEADKSKHKEKKQGWLRRLSRRGGHESEEPKPSKLHKAKDRQGVPGPNDGENVTDPTSSSAVDVTKSHPGSGTDDMPHIPEASAEDIAAAEEKEPATVIEPTTGQPIGTRKGGLDTSGTDGIPHVQPHGESTATTTSPIHTTTNNGAAATPPPAPVGATASASNALTEASPGRPNISAPLSKHPIQNSTGFAVETPPPPPPAPAGVGPSLALEPGIPPSAGAFEGKTPEGSARAVALARADSAAAAHDGSVSQPRTASEFSDSDAEDNRRRAALLQEEHGAVLGHTEAAGRATHRPFQRQGVRTRTWSSDSSSSDEDEAPRVARRPGGGGMRTSLRKSTDDVARDEETREGETQREGRAAGFRASLGLGRLKDKLAGAGPSTRRDGSGRAEDEDEDEEFQEARDHVDNTDLAPPKPLTETRGASTPSPVRGTRFREELGE